MIRVGSYVRYKSSEVALRVFAVGNMPLPNRSTKVPAARCRGPAPAGTRATFAYATHALADLTEVQVNLVCDVCKAPATHDNGRVATRFFCDVHARPGDPPLQP